MKIDLYKLYNLIYRGIHEKFSRDVVSAVCYTIYTINLSLCTQTAVPLSGGGGGKALAINKKNFLALFVNSPAF